MATSANRTYVITKNNQAQWNTNNPILANLEIGVERDSGFFKIGNGVHTWNTLPYVVSAGAKGLIVFVSDDPDNLVVYGADGGIKLPGEYFNAGADYLAGKSGNNSVPIPTKLYHQTIFTIGRDIKDILVDVSNLQHRVELVGRSVGIDDTTNTSTSATWSAAKIVDSILQADINLKDDLLNNHTAAYNTLQTFATYLASDPNLATSLATELDNMVKFNMEQVLTTNQKEQARYNIDAVGKEEVGVAVNLLDTYNEKLGDATGSLFIERSL